MRKINNEWIKPEMMLPNVTSFNNSILFPYIQSLTKSFAFWNVAVYVLVNFEQFWCAKSKDNLLFFSFPVTEYHILCQPLSWLGSVTTKGEEINAHLNFKYNISYEIHK